jgi:DNA-binding NarL/FixJ family response regulator
MVIRVLIVEDFPVTREGLIAFLSRAADIEVVGIAENGEQAINEISRLEPDIVLLDYLLSDMSGRKVMDTVAQSGLQTRFLCFSAYDNGQSVYDMLSGGALGYIHKTEQPEKIIDAVRAVARNEEWLSSKIAAQLLVQVRRAFSKMTRLSEREKEILQLVADGKSNQLIADTLNLSEGTVKNHLVRIYTKLEVNSRAEAVAWMWQHGRTKKGPSEQP